MNELLLTADNSKAYKDGELDLLRQEERVRLVEARAKIHKTAKEGNKVLRRLRESGRLVISASLLPYENSHKNLLYALDGATKRPALLFTQRGSVANELKALGATRVLAAQPNRTDPRQLVFFRELRDQFLDAIERDNAVVPVTAEPTVPPQQPAGDHNAIALQLPDGLHTNLRLGKSMGSGGEGDIYQLSDPRYRDVAVKIYFPKYRTAQRREKIQYMMANAPQIPTLAWPVGMVFDCVGNWIGFAMPRVMGVELADTVFHPGRGCRNLVDHSWDRLALVNMACSVVETFEQMHQRDILMGDINPRNFLVAPNGVVHLVDCDSYQFGDYICPVGTPLFTPPEKHREMKRQNTEDYGYRRTIQHELYSLAVLLFEILMLGKAPYESSGNTSQDVVEAIISGSFPYSFKDATDAENQRAEKVPLGKWRNIWSHMSYPLKGQFFRTFVRGERFSASEWYTRLQEQAQYIQKGWSDNQLMPDTFKTLQNDSDATKMVNLTCEHCKCNFNMGEDVYQQRMKQRSTVLCETCRASEQNARREIIPLVCDSCGQDFVEMTVDRWKTLYRQGKPIYCNRCMDIHVPMVRCGQCGTSHRQPKERIETLRWQNKHPLCKACRGKISSGRDGR